MSDVAEEVNHSTSEEPHTTLPGKRLRQARELRNLQQADIAKELKLDLRFIRALEEGRFNELPQPVYTAGYVRAYAKLVGLSPDEIVAEYTAYHKSSSSTKTKSRTKTKEHIPSHYRQVQDTLPKSFSVGNVQSDDKRKLNILISVLAVVVVFAIAWQLSSRQSDKTAPVTVDIKQPAPDSSTGTGASNADDPPIKNAAPEAATGIPEGGNPSTVQPESSAPATQPDGTGMIKSTDQSSGASSEQLTEEKEVTQELVRNADKMTELSIEFSADSWIDIRDATGKRIMRKLGHAGRSSTVSGIAPFDILLGYSPGVSIEYDGKPYDMRAHSDQRVSRFTLSDDSVASYDSDQQQSE